MNKLLTIFGLLFSVLAFAQPANDDCMGIIEFGVAPACDSTILYNNIDATASDIGFDNIPTGCEGGDFDTMDRDVWFSFIASSTIFDYTVEVIGCPDEVNNLPSMMNPQIAIYRGDCEFNGLQLLNCVRSENLETNIDLNLQGLTPGITYFIRVNDWSPSGTPNAGAFKMCIKEKDPVVIIGEDTFSTDCSGEIFDSGGPDGDYGNDEDNVFTVCPATFHNCINFTLEYYNLESFADQIIFYDGPSTSSPIIGQTTGGNFATSGGVCLQVAASSGCITLQFLSDSELSFEGFHGFWECTLAECDLPEPITVNTLADEQEIIDNIVTPQTTVTIDTIICPDGAIGTFEAEGSDLGLDNGLVITSGLATGAIGPSSNFASNIIGAPGDDDLDLISIAAGDTLISGDACIIELDVFAATDELTFEYVFGSEEYPEFAGQEFNDIFAFLISGPGIVGDPIIDNQLNIATLPDGTLVEINSVNDESNWEYYRDNTQPFGATDNQLGLSIGYDGLTSDFLGIKKSLTARADVIPCNTYHLKLAIADRFDTVWDSGVFISELKGGSPEISVNFTNGINYLVEGCTAIPDQVLIDIGTPQEDTTRFTIVVSGTAEQGVDYTLDLPIEVLFPPGETQISFPISAIVDNIDEGVETIILALTNDFGCGPVTFSTVTIELRDELNVEIFAGADTVFICQGICREMEVSGAQEYFWTPPAFFNPPDAANSEYCSDVSQFIEVLGTLGVCSDMDTIWAQVLDPMLEIQTDDITNICAGTTVSMESVNNINNSNLQWTPAVGLSDPNAQSVIATPEFNTSYIATVALEGCSASDTININVDIFDFPELTTLDTLICENYSVTLATNIGFTNTNYEWTSTPNDMSMTCVDCPNPTVTPNTSTSYEIIATSQNAYCADTATVDIEVFPVDVEILNPDTIEICLGEIVNLDAIVSNDGSNFSWSPSTGLTNDTLTQTIASPTQTTQYISTLVIGACTVFDSVLVVVDSLPDLSITAIPEKESYCEGEEVTLVSNIYEPADFPFIEHLWSPLNGVQTPDSNLNLVLNALDTTVYVRTTINRGCTSIDSIRINVVPSDVMTLLPSDTSLCPGVPVQMELILDSPLITDISYEPMEAVSCQGCTDPIATVFETTQIVVSAEFDGCPVGTSALINIENAPFLSFPADNNLCNGESIILNTNPAASNTYVWTASDGSDVPDIPAPQVSPTVTTTYTVTASNGICDLTRDFTVNVFEDPVFDLVTGAIICSDESIELNSLLDEDATYNWTGQGITASTANLAQPTVTPGEAGTFTYNLEIANLGCTVNTSTMVTVLAPPVYDLLEAQTVCPGDVVTLNGLAGEPDASFSWTATPGGFTSNLDQPTTAVNETTTYILNVSNAACEVIDEVTISVFEDFDLILVGDTICWNDETGGMLMLATSNGTEGIITWDNTSGTLDCTDCPNPVANPSTTTAYTVSFQDANTCFEPKVGTATLTVIEEFVIDTIEAFTQGGTSSADFAEGQFIDFVATISGDTAGLIYTWNLGGMDIDAPNESFLDDYRAASIGGLNVTLTLTDPNGCEISYTVTVNIDENRIRIPNVFTPNEDNSNEVFRIVTNVPIFIDEFRIYDRWGNLVFDNGEGTDEWDGTYKDKPAEADVYLYMIHYKLNENDTEVIVEKGDVTLVR